MRVVRRVDHVRVYVSDPQILFDALTKQLGLPVGLPITRQPGSLSALVILGNMFVEVIRPAPGRRVGVPLDRGAFGVVFEPDSIEDAVAELDRRSIPHLTPFPDPTPPPSGGLFDFDPTAVPCWTPVMIGGVLGDRVVARNAPRTPQSVARLMTRALLRFWGVRLADRMFQMMSQTRAVYVNEFHPQLRVAMHPDRTRGFLDDVGGGMIGLTGVSEIVLGVADIEHEIQRWQALLEPAVLLGVGHWQLPAGPTIRLESSPDPSGRLICEVKDIDAARAFLRDQGLLGDSTNDEVQIAPKALAGLDIRLVPR